MKKLIALLLSAVMLLSMTACGGSAEPVETASVTPEPTVVETEAPTEVPTEEPSKPLELGDVQTIQYGEFTVELHTFAIQYGEKTSVYQYRPGMSPSDWACSALNTDGWIPWYGDEILSPDRAYSYSTGYLDMRDYMDNNGVIVAEEYDGNTNYINNDGAAVEFTPFDSDTNTGTSIFTDTGAVDEAALQEFLAQNGLDDGVPITVVPYTGGADTTSADDVSNAIATEENEIAERGNISVPVAHMVNAKTPLFTPGFRIVSKEDGRAAYHSVEMNGNLLLDDIIDIYMNGIDDALIPHIKLYAFPESEEFLSTLEGHTILNAHPTPLEQGDEMLTIPENALCLTFARVADGQEAPNTPNPRKPAHGNLNKDAVYARYVTKDDPNFGEGVNLVFAITFDDELVYWIHMGANFNESSSVMHIVDAMVY